MKVFLGGTVNKSTWRNELIPKLDVDFFNPVVEEWTEKARLQELEERKTCDYLLYVLTPKMTGYYSIAEVTDDSFRRPDRTIFCYLENDDGQKFTIQQQKDLQFLSKKVIKNGAIYLRTLDDIAQFLNSAVTRKKSILKDSEQMFDAFISYGRRHSSAFVANLYDKLLDKGEKVWLDKNNIPLAVDFQDQIDDGIIHSDNFIFVISPHSVKSEYCLKEIMLAKKHGKRIIPILHIEPKDNWHLIHPEIARLNWIYLRQNEDFSIPLEKWKDIDNFNQGFNSILEIFNIEKNYVRFHTLLLHNALKWNREFRKTSNLLTGQDRSEADNWLKRKKFKNPKTETLLAAPCKVTSLQAEYILQSKKNALNLQSEAFISYTPKKSFQLSQIIHSLNHRGISSWEHNIDIPKGADYNKSIHDGIIQADNYLFFINKSILQDEKLESELRIAKKFNKRIIPILLEKIDDNERKKLPWYIRNLNFLNFTDISYRKTQEKIKVSTLEEQKKLTANLENQNRKNDFEKRMDELILILEKDADYIKKHKYILSKALKWKNQNKNQSVLLRGKNLENALTWIDESKLKDIKPVQEQIEYIKASNENKGLIDTDIYISFSPKDFDFANQLNDFLQMSGKNTWFNQETLEGEPIFDPIENNENIQNSENFLFISSPYSVSSKYCLEGLNYAVKLHKRILNLNYLDSEINSLPKALQKIKPINFAKKNFTETFTQLLRNIDVDREYIKQHTKYIRLANEWKEKGKREELLLRGKELILAVEWLNEADNYKGESTNHLIHPMPTPFQKEYIQKSILQEKKEKEEKREHRRRMSALQAEKIKEAEMRIKEQKKSTRRQRILLVFMSIMLIIASISLFIALNQRKIATQNAKKTDSLYNEVIKQKQLVNTSKFQLELALASIDSLQKLLSVSIKNASSIEEAQSIVIEYNQKVEIKKKESGSLLLTEDVPFIKKGNTNIRKEINKIKKETQKMNVDVLRDSVEQLNSQLKGHMKEERKKLKYVKLIAMYSVLAEKEKKLSPKLKESSAYDKLIITKRELDDKIALTLDVIKIRESLLLKRPSNTVIKEDLAINYTNLSWYYLLRNDNIKATKSIHRAKNLANNVRANIYYAYTLLLDDKKKEGLQILDKYANHISPDKYTYKKMYLTQLNTLIKFGIKNKNLKIALRKYQ